MTPAKRLKELIVQDRNNFDAAFPKLIETAMAGLPSETSSAIAHFENQHLWKSQPTKAEGTCGKMNRGMTVLSTWRLLLSDKTPSDDEYDSAIVLAWCIELLQAFFLVADDVMDQSWTRRGKPCWFRQEDVGYIAINDSFMLEALVYRLIDFYFRGKSCYKNITRLVHEVTYQTGTGQTLDLITKPGENFVNFTLARYKAIVKWKTSFYSFYFPVALALYMHNITDAKVHDISKEILLEMGEFFQIQDDYLDCYGDPAITGKVGTDIEETKCSWLLVQALQKVDEPQRKVLEENYGVNDPAAVAKVKEIYSKLDLKSIYKKYEEVSYQKLMKLIEDVPSELPKEIFTQLAAKLYKRDK